jgi:hypothetical protein
MIVIMLICGLLALVRGEGKTATSIVQKAGR